MTKKILFVVNIDWFFISHRLPLAIEALRKGYDVSVACGTTDKKNRLESFGINVYPLNISRGSTGVQKEIRAFIEIYNVLKIMKPDVTHFITIKPVLYGGIASRILKINNTVFSISGLGFIFIKQGVKASIVRKFIKGLYRLALGGKNSHVIVQNPDDRDVVLSIRKVPITLIRGSGVDLNQYKYTQENNEDIRVVMACRFLKDKGVFEYIEAAKIIKDKGIDVTFELYGDIDSANPASLINADLEQIKRDTYVEVHDFSSDIASIFEKANIVVLPSYREGLPKVLIEAAACGRAVVTTDVPGCRDAIEANITGLLCKVKDSKSLAGQIEKLVLNEELRKSMGKAGRKLAEKEFDIQKVIQKHFEIYEESL
ncbi:MAG: glycosyltransferase family 4 protein [Sulfurospirillum sp.]